MAYEDNNSSKTYVRETQTQSSGPGMALLVGGLVVAVGFILWLIFSAAQPVATVPEVDETNVTIEPAAPAPAAPVTDAPAADDPAAGAPVTEDAVPAPAPDAAAPAPAPETEPAPANP